jgi:hypothetical protein
MQGYDHPIQQTIVAKGNTAISTLADIFQVSSPVGGKKGRVVGMSICTTVANTGAAGNILFGTVADTDAYGSIPVPVTAIDKRVPVTKAQLAALLDLPANTLCLISGDGLGTGGAVDLAITIGWF